MWKMKQLSEWSPRRRSPVALAGIAIIAVLAACGGSTEKGASGSSILEIRSADDPSNLDPHKVLSTSGLQFSYYLYDTLVGQNEKGEPVPKLATKWDASPTKLTMTIRDDITCSDGTKMTPSVIKANFDRLQDPKLQAPYVENFLGTREYAVTADDAANTVTIKLPKPFAPLLANLAQYPPMLCQAALDDPKALQKKPVGTGPFVLKERVVGDHYTLAKRTGYTWGPGGATTAVDGFPSKVTIRVVPNETTAANQLGTGELSIAPIGGPERERLQGDSGLTSQDAAGGVSIIHFNEAKGRPGADPAIRKALVQALDRKAMTAAAYANFSEVMGTVVLPGSQCFSQGPGDAIPPFDPEAAKAVLAEAAPSLKFLAIATEGGEYAAEAWKQAGAKVDANISSEAGSGLETVFGGGDWDVALFAWTGVTNVSSLSPYLEGPVPPDGTNFASIDNPGFSRQAALAKSEVGAAGCSADNQAEADLYATSDMLPISLITTGLYAQKGVEFDTRFGAIEPTSLRTAGRD